MWSEFIGCWVILAAAILAVAGHNSGALSAGIVGIILNLATSIPSSIGWCLKQWVQLEVEFVAAERVQQYGELTVESAEGACPPLEWPCNGTIVARGLTMRYRDDLDPVLRGLCFDIPARAKVAVVGPLICDATCIL